MDTLQKSFLAALLTGWMVACSGDSIDETEPADPSNEEPIALCGNGVVDAGELCDGNCVSECVMQNPCDTGVLTGSAATCDVECVTTTMTECADGDVCCPTGCTTDEDRDCAEDALVVGPFLQTATPQSIWISWETQAVEYSRVDWGPTPALGNVATATATGTLAGSQIHEIQLTGLEPATRYYYRASSGGTYSAVYDFITPPLRDSETDVRLVAMSDMQQSSANPNKFDEVIHEGVLDYLADTYSNDVPAELAMVLVPGDLVDDGWSYSDWVDTFFGPAQDLISRVPLYSVLGNHESNTPYYFSYFRLPDNGPSGYEEHSWYTDYSNIRVIGLDSNLGYRTQTQLDWLEGVLTDSCTDPVIDFVFAQLHHPHKSELWVAGELDFTGDVIALMEAFSSNCSKPSIHFFGHTHGYSRGQSRDHQHLWVNVATAGGGIDYWGEYVQRDYDEFTVTQPEWGFVTIDVEAGDTPSFTLRRLSRGNAQVARDNEERDRIVIRRDNNAPATPTVVGPSGEMLCGSGATLTASDYIDEDGDAHAGSHWQVAYTCDDFQNSVAEKWSQSENWYNGEDRQAGDDLRDEMIAELEPGHSYCWRVRYRDAGLVWSAWSQSAIFTTADMGGNLLTNAGAEDGTAGWTTVEGYHESLTSGECNGIAPFAGDKYFATGGLCDSADYSEASQPVAIAEEQWAEVDAGLGTAYFGGYLATYSGEDKPELQLRFLDASGALIGSSDKIISQENTWSFVASTTAIAVGTRTIEFVLMGTRQSGLDSDCYFDELVLKTGSCD